MTTTSIPPRKNPISVWALGVALSAALVVLYILCAAAAIIAPTAPLAHGWLALFSTAPVNSATSWVEGILGSVAFGWVTAVVLGVVYNRLASD